MIFELARDYADALAAIPRDHPKRRTLELFEEAIRRDIHFIDRHPTTLFQCMWNLCWWYDCPEAAEHYPEPEGGWPDRSLPLPWESEECKLSKVLEVWRGFRGANSDLYPRCWIRSFYPPILHLGTGLKTRLDAREPFTAISPDNRIVILAGKGESTNGGHVRILDIATGVSIATVVIEDNLCAISFERNRSCERNPSALEQTSTRPS